MAQVEVVLQKERKSQPTGLKFVERQGAEVFVAEVEVESIAHGKLFPGDKIVAVNDYPVLNRVICESMCEGTPRELILTVERPVESEPQMTSSTPNPTEPQLISSTANQTEPQLTISTAATTEPEMVSSTPNPTELQLINSTANSTENVPNATDNTGNPDEIQPRMTLVNAVLWKENMWQSSGLRLKTVDGKVIVAFVTPKSPADGVLQIGDELVRVNDYPRLYGLKLGEIQLESASPGRIDLVLRRESAKPSSEAPKSSSAEQQLSESSPELFTFPVVLQKAHRWQSTGLKFAESQKGQVYVAAVHCDSIASGKLKIGDKVVAIDDHPVLSKANCQSMCKSAKGQLTLTVGIPKWTSSFQWK